MVTTGELTISLSGAEALGAYVAFPEYTAVTVRAPEMAKVQLKAARPLASGTVTGLFRLMVKVTAPVGVPLWPVTVAVKVTGWPTIAEALEVTRLVVVPTSTTSFNVDEVLLRLFASPEYTAVIGWFPMAEKAVV